MVDRDFEQRDPIIERVRDTLAPMPKVDPSDVARMLVAIQGKRRTLRERVAERLWFMRMPSVSVIGTGAVAALALIVGFLGRGAIGRDNTETSTAATDVAAATVIAPSNSAAVVQNVAAASMDELAVPVQFVLSIPNAKSVSLVGDFNAWDTTDALLEQVPGQQLWTVTVNLKPGRHVYAFVVDGTKWMRDPRAAEAVDEDFGRPQSVIVVQVPWTGSR
jgi:hypothetical protein